jgi:hypothetical protein
MPRVASIAKIAVVVIIAKTASGRMRRMAFRRAITRVTFAISPAAVVEDVLKRANAILATLAGNL